MRPLFLKKSAPALGGFLLFVYSFHFTDSSEVVKLYKCSVRFPDLFLPDNRPFPFSLNPDEDKALEECTSSRLSYRDLNPIESRRLSSPSTPVTTSSWEEMDLASPTFSMPSRSGQ